MLKRSNSQGEIDFLGNACTNLLEDNNDQLFNGNGFTLGGSYYPHGPYGAHAPSYDQGGFFS